jgi:hypothetical protein
MHIVIAKGLPRTDKIIIIDLSFNNRRLGYQKLTAEGHEMICRASIFGGTSIY